MQLNRIKEFISNHKLQITGCASALLLAATIAVAASLPGDPPVPPDDRTVSADTGAVPDGRQGDSGNSASGNDQGPDVAPDARGDIQQMIADSLEAEHEEGDFLVSPAEGATDAELEAAVPGSKVLQRTRRFAKMSVPDGMSVAQALESAASSSAVDGFQPNYIYHEEQSDLTPNDPIYAGYYNTSGTWMEQWGAKSIGMVPAWEKLASSTGGNPPDVAIAVLDNGFATGHQDLGNLRASYNTNTETGNVAPTTMSNLKDRSATEVPNTSGFSHGTHVAGIVGATANNGIGVAGVSYNSTVIPIKIFHWQWDSDSSSWVSNANSFDVAAGFDYLLGIKDTYNIRVANMSLGATRNAESLSYKDFATFQSMAEAYSQGIVTVCAAGNGIKDPNTGVSSGSTIYHYPSDYEQAVAVINLVQDNGNPDGVARSSTSNYNADGAYAKCISAPGGSIISTFNGTSSYGSSSGTSMAAPHVSGTLALMFRQHPELTAGDAISKLYSTATDLSSKGFDAETGFGEVNASQALDENSVYLSGEPMTQVGMTTRLVPSDTGVFTWVSSDESIATVSDGYVYGVAEGDVVITASDGVHTACQIVSVYSNEISGNRKLSVGSVQLYQTPQPWRGAWTWSADDPEVLGVEPGTGKATGLKSGHAVLTATLINDPDVKCSLPVAVGSAAVIEHTLSIQGDSTAYVGEARQYTATSNSASGIRWASTNPAVFTVDDSGLISPVAPGTASLVAMLADDTSVMDSMAITVERRGISLSGAEEILVGNTAQYEATTDSEGGVVWSVSDPLLATISDSGFFTALSAGTVTVTAALQADPSTKATQEVVISHPTLSIDGDSIAYIGDRHDYTVSSNSDDPTVIWKISDPSKGVISNGGTLSPSATGEVLVTATLVVDPDVSATKSVEIRKHTLSLQGPDTVYVGDSTTFAPVCESEEPSINWETSDVSVADVDGEGNVVGKGTGNARITVTLATDVTVTAYKDVTVVHHTAYISGTNLLHVGLDSKLDAYTETGLADGVNWESSNPDILSVDDDGEIRAHAVGNATITASLKSDPEARAEHGVEVFTYTLGITGESSLPIGGSAQLTASTDAPAPVITWSSSDDTIASVDGNGVVSAHKAGNAVITAALEEYGLSQTHDIEVAGYSLEIAGVEKMHVGENKTLYATTDGPGRILWTSSNTDIATVVASGETTIVHAVANGNVTITATLENFPSITATHDIVVSDYALSAQPIPALHIGESADIAFETDDPQGVTFSSQDESVATVTGSGHVVAVGNGSSNIIVALKTSPSVTITLPVSVEAYSLAVDGAQTAHIGTNEQYTATTDAPGNVLWSVSNGSIATITAGGVLVPIAPGSVDIIATLGNDPSTTVRKTVTVEHYFLGIGNVPDSIYVNGPTVPLWPSTEAPGGVRWSSSAPSVISIDQNGVMTALREGSAIISATLVCDPEVVNQLPPIQARKYFLNLSGPTKVNMGAAITITADTDSPMGINWSSSDESKATVSNGIVQGVAGSSTPVVITASLVQDPSVSKTWNVTVEDPTPVSISGPDSVYVGDSISLTASIPGSSWKVDKPALATITDAGVLTGISNGQVEVSATAPNGKTAKKTVAVDRYPAPIISGSNSVVVDSTIRLNAQTAAGAGSVIWSSDNEAVATVDGNGTVTGRTPGTANIRATLAKDRSVISEPKPIEVTPKTVPSDVKITGASNIPLYASTQVVGSSSKYSLKFQNPAEAAMGAISGVTFTAGSRTGKVTLGVYDKSGTIFYKTHTINIYKLSGTYSIRSNVDSNFAVNVKNGSSANGANIALWQVNTGSRAQQFRFVLQSDHSYKIQNVQSGKMIAVAGNSSKENANIYQWKNRSLAGQKWRMNVDAKDNITFINGASKKAMTSTAGATVNGRNIKQFANAGLKSQKWTLVQIS